MIAMEWGGKTYTILPSEAFVVGEEVEAIVTLAEIPEMVKNPRFRKLARVHGTMLRHAGADVTDQAIHAAMIEEVKNPTNGQVLWAQALSALVAILMDGAPEADGAEPPKKVSASSAPRSKSR